MPSPYDDDRAHLTPLLETFQPSGNHAVGEWFVPRETGGWDVYLRGPLDVAIIERHLAEDPFASEMGFANDTLHCSHCSTWVYGLDAPE